MTARTGFRPLDAPAQNALELPASGNSIRRGVRFCPTYRRIRDVVEPRRLVHITPSSSPDHGLCADKGSGRTVRGIDLSSWRKTMEIWSACPLPTKCREELNTQLDLGQRPREQIVEALLVTTTGRAVTPRRARRVRVPQCTHRLPAASSRRGPSRAARIREVAA